jgi:hypothetical protein
MTFGGNAGVEIVEGSIVIEILDIREDGLQDIDDLPNLVLKVFQVLRVIDLLLINELVEYLLGLFRRRHIVKVR